MRTKQSAASSPREKLVRKSASDIQRFLHLPAGKAQMASLKKSGSNPTAADLQEIPELTKEELATARGIPKKVPVTTRLDSDIVVWLKAGGTRYQTRMNSILRAVMNQDARKVSPAGKRSG